MIPKNREHAPCHWVPEFSVRALHGPDEKTQEADGSASKWNEDCQGSSACRKKREGRTRLGLPERLETLRRVAYNSALALAVVASANSLLEPLDNY
ncbi:hypothetical protein DAPPUDRAFT_245970 [Daphnia pulex]|uniref:Uncharacterized protein n=1 Tax=Daphnia pulex TaxID=6669 RepID=E9GPE1_DAPPU|nr:hypothetical protein DAPPUDRAFT_245970 [Daphnia pulex]|eukprot:EFX78695.1 hypothetical protein DAPPUDRAFT_245970 [Daphnia pulex]